MKNVLNYQTSEYDCGPLFSVCICVIAFAILQRKRTDVTVWSESREAARA